MKFLNFNEDAFLQLSNLLMYSESLKVLDLSYNTFYEKYVERLSTGLGTCKLEKLILKNIFIDGSNMVNF